MDRLIVYPAQVPLETDLLNTNKFAMIALAKLASAVLGAGPLLHGLPCTPGTGLTVVVGVGEIYKTANIDDSAYSSIASDTTHQVLKQGLLMDSATLNCPAPGTTGQSINYLVQVKFDEVDTGATVLPYYNASNPALVYTGPSNSGTPNMTIRSGKCTVSIKAGTAAATGTQTTPAPDSGYTGAYVVTIANGASSVVTGNISIASGAPFLTTTLPTAAPLNSPAFTGTPTAPTQPAGDASTELATDEFVQIALNGVASVPVGGNTDVTLTQSQWGKGIIILTGALTGNINVVVPDASRKWLVSNRTTGAFGITFKTVDGTGVPIKQGKSKPVYSDGTNVLDARTDFQDVALTGAPTAPTPSPGDASTKIATTAYADAAVAAAATATSNLGNNALYQLHTLY